MGPKCMPRLARPMVVEVKGVIEKSYVSQSDHEIDRDKLKEDMCKDYSTDSEGPSNQASKIQKRS